MERRRKGGKNERRREAGEGIKEREGERWKERVADRFSP